MDDFFKKLPKMTNNHIHIFAMLPYRKLLKMIKKIDPELYDRVYALTVDVITDGDEKLYKNSLELINDRVDGIPMKGITKREDWVKVSTLDPSFKNSLVVTKHTENPFAEFEKIQTRFRIFVRHYKVYYYLWYTSLYVNYNNNVFYLNVRGKPGTIHKDVKFDNIFFLESKQVMSDQSFSAKLTEIAKDDKDIKPNDHKYMYKQYTRIKYESDLILKAVNDFNKNRTYPHFVNDNHLYNDKVDISFDENYQKDKPQMMVQYIITFPKKPKSVELDLRMYMLYVKKILYIAAVINEEYGFPFFNGIDLVGNEQESHDLSEFIPIMGKLLYFRRFGINFIPHIGETNIVKNEITPMERLIFDKNITRIGHGISFVTTEAITTELKKLNRTITIESCPISNYLLGYYHPRSHPHQAAINNPNIKLMICSDDNGLFNYSSVSRDYLFAHKYWNLTMKDLKKLILNGLSVIPQKYKKYYYDVFNYLWQKYEMDKYPNKLTFDK